MKKEKKNYRSPEIEEVKLDKEISMQYQSVSRTSPDDPFKQAPSNPSRMSRQAEDPYQYETW